MKPSQDQRGARIEALCSVAPPGEVMADLADAVYSLIEAIENRQPPNVPFSADPELAAVLDQARRWVGLDIAVADLP